MSDEINNSVSATESSDATEDYVEALNQLKANTVDKAKYDQLRLENKKLLDSIVNGTAIEQQAQEPKKSIEELRKEYFREDQNNLEQITSALNLRKALIEKGENDPFLPYGKQILPTDEDIATANRVADVLQECVDYANGDSNVFTNELQRRMVDTKVR